MVGGYAEFYARFTFANDEINHQKRLYRLSFHHHLPKISNFKFF